MNKLVLYNLDTGRQTVLLDRPIGYPNWSRDGQYLFANDGGGAGWWRVRVRDRGSELLKISQRINRAEWGWFGLNPDGSILTARDNGTNEVYALDLDLP